MQKSVFAALGMLLALSAEANAACISGTWNTASGGRTRYFTLHNGCVGRVNVRYCTNSGCDSATLDTNQKSGWIGINQSTPIKWCECPRT